MIDVAGMLGQIEESIMSGLKDFQRATVERIDYLFRQGRRRILVSDEVGLGKTLIARGAIAKLALMRKEDKDNLVKVVYICSNAAIAEQNLNKLRIASDVKTESAGTSRLSMQHLNIFMQEHDQDLLGRYIQLIPLTPDTSFRTSSSMGTVGERALLFALLRRIESLENHKNQLEILMMHRASARWSEHKEWYEQQVLECDEISNGAYINYMREKITEGLNEKNSKGNSLLQRIITACTDISNGSQNCNNNGVIKDIRLLFAKISLDKLEPDLVIMDEFQRFKYLINSDPESETGMLAHKFFNSESVRMLLLSATPYKMYSTLEEIDESQVDEHYSEFLDVMAFLNISDDEQNDFKEVWSNYSVKLKEFSSKDTALLLAKREAEDAMYRMVCRTERISASESADIIDASEAAPIDITEQDVKSYISAQKLLEDIGATYHVPIDYVKSSPYLLSFMKDYRLKRNVERYFKAHPNEVDKANKPYLWISKSKLDKYEQVPSGNARLEVIKKHAFQKNAELLLWVPPCMPYYEPSGAYKGTENFSKILVFSSWEMVPRMISGMLSYEAERKTVGSLAKKSGEKIHYFYSDNAGENAKRKRFPPPRLNFALKDNQASAMNLLCLLYPSSFLTECYNPIECLNNHSSMRETESQIKRKIYLRLSPYVSQKTDDYSKSGGSDKRWYYMAPILLDGREYFYAWHENFHPLGEGKDGSMGLSKHVSTLYQLAASIFNGEEGLGKIPVDLYDVLADMAIASPAVCMNRTYRKYLDANEFDSALASQFAQAFINRMNTPESTAVVELCYGKSEEAHWRNLLSYCKSGNIQAMLDEYAHLIANGIDKDKKIVQRLHEAITESMSIRTTLYSVDTFSSFKTRVASSKTSQNNLRTHFAVAFTKGDSSSDKSTDRKRIVRNAFNSPFRPFVLASTSIGQEGLDFHNYCRKIVHWNLPSNPIDLEQREGRINRFECLAIRQNISRRYRHLTFTKDVWSEMFEFAVEDTKQSNQHSSDLIPFWGLPSTEDMVKIERIVPMYPFSKDITAYERMIKILSLYRLTLGQARQEELLEYIIQSGEDDEDLKKLFINLSPHYKK